MIAARAVRDVTGAFADGAILFPLLAALTVRSDFSAATLLLTAGLAYWAAGLVFRVPMSVQPLKSIAIAAIAIGATAAEVRLSGALLGAFCLAISLLGAERWAAKVPASLVHALQLGLGVILCRQGWLAAGAHPFASPPATLALVAALTLALAMLLVARGRSGLPLLGIVATAGLAWAVLHPLTTSTSTAAAVAAEGGGPAAIRLGIVLALVLPQVALTSANSVLGTYDVARRYYGDRAGRVTITRLLRSIGWGNLLSAAVGGLPYCHGSGGVTAHARGGATHWRSNAIIGSSLLVFAAIQAMGGGLHLAYPPVLMSALLIATGVFHMGLAERTWNGGAIGAPWARTRLVLAALVALATQNMLWTLIVATAGELLAHGALARPRATPPGLASTPAPALATEASP